MKFRSWSHSIAYNVLQLGEVAEIEAQNSVLHKSSIEELNLNLALNPPFCQTAVLWSDGYFVCSIGESSPETIRQYILSQG
jgi:REP element-mobilizing transposase RayT